MERVEVSSSRELPLSAATWAMASRPRCSVSTDTSRASSAAPGPSSALLPPSDRTSYTSSGISAGLGPLESYR